MIIYGNNNETQQSPPAKQKQIVINSLNVSVDCSSNNQIYNPHLTLIKTINKSFKNTSKSYKFNKTSLNFSNGLSRDDIHNKDAISQNIISSPISNNEF